MENQPEEFEIHLRAVRDRHNRPTVDRLRMALKCLLRSFGLKCTSVSRREDRSQTEPVEPQAERECSMYVQEMQSEKVRQCSHAVLTGAGVVDGDMGSNS